MFYPRRQRLRHIRFVRVYLHAKPQHQNQTEATASDSYYIPDGENVVREKLCDDIIDPTITTQARTISSKPHAEQTRQSDDDEF